MKRTTILALTAALLWATAYAGVKIGLEYAEPFFFAGIRFMISGLLIIPFAGRIRGYVSFFRENWRTVLPVSLLQTSLFYGLYFQGINLVPAAVAAVVMGSEPLFVALTAHALTHDDKFTLRKGFSIAGAVIGIALLSMQRDFGDAAGLREILGIAVLLLTCFVGSFGQMIVKRKALDPLFLNSQQIFLGGAVLLIMSLITGEKMPVSLPLPFISVLLWLSFVSACAFSIWYSLLKRREVKVSELNLYKFIIPVAGAVFSWLMIPAEGPDLITVIGMVLIAVSVMLFFLNRERLPKVIRNME